MSRIQPQDVNLVLYHAGCPDGFGAAFAAWKALGDDRCIYRGSHTDAKTLPDVRGKTVVLLDFCYPSSTVQRLLQEARGLLVIDHHQSTLDDLVDIPDYCKLIDTTCSACILAWRFFHGPHVLAPPLLLYLQDRDLWQWKLRHSQEICAGLDTYDSTFQQWDRLCTSAALPHLRALGQPILRYRQRILTTLGARSLQAVFHGFVCRVVNAPGGELTSYLGQHLMDTYKVSLTLLWHIDHASQQLKLSLRSTAPVNTLDLVRRYGGGGHPQASALSIPLEQLRHPSLQPLTDCLGLRWPSPQ